MPQLIRKQSGLIKVSLHAAILERTYDILSQKAISEKISMGEMLDKLIGGKNG